MSDQTPERDDDLLAAEFVIGLIEPAERADVARRIQTDAGFAARVAEWEERMEQLNDDYGTMTPPARLKQAIDARLFGEPASTRRPWSGLVRWALMAAAAAVVAVVFVFWSQGPAFEGELIAEDGTYRFDVRVAPQSVEIAVSEGVLDADRTYELWLIPESGVPVSLGIFDGEAELLVGTDLSLQDGSVLAVSIEPEGGSPTGQPTGPVVAVGSLNST